MILRPGPQTNWLDRLPIRGFLLFLMLSSTGIFVTSIWRLHLISATSYRTVSISSKYESEPLNKLTFSGDLDGLKNDLSELIRTENEQLLHAILERIQYLSMNHGSDGVPVEVMAPKIGPPGQYSLVRNISDLGHNVDNLQFAGIAKQVPYQTNLTAEFWKRDWREVLELDDKARAYLDNYQIACEQMDRLDEVVTRRGMSKKVVTLPLCPCIPGTLEGRHRPDVDFLMSTTWDMTSSLANSVLLGGYWKPRDCLARRRIAVIIPCRDRETQLRAFLIHTHPLLQRQLLEYRIFVVEQTWPAIFNKASSMNAGFLEATKLFPFDCVMFHDVDLLPEDDRSVIYCGDTPLHYGAHLDKWNYNVGYARIFGGAVSMTREQFVRSNGFSNVYFGWGGEDDEFDKRVRAAGYDVNRPPPEVSKHTTLMHKRDSANPVNPGSGRSWVSRPSLYSQEGLNTVQYESNDVLLEPLFTWIKVKLKLTPDRTLMGQDPYRYFEVRGGCFSPPDSLAVIDELPLSLISCRYQCDMEPHCKAILYYERRDNHCVRLNTLCRIQQGVPGVVMYIKAMNETDLHYKMTPGDCHGNDIEGLKVTLSQCIESCSHRRDCAGFVYGELLTLPCWLKNDTCTEPKPSVLGVKSYTKLKPDH